jgi:hypothetical protein
VEESLCRTRFRIGLTPPNESSFDLEAETGGGLSAPPVSSSSMVGVRLLFLKAGEIAKSPPMEDTES